MLIFFLFDISVNIRKGREPSIVLSRSQYLAVPYDNPPSGKEIPCQPRDFIILMFIRTDVLIVLRRCASTPYAVARQVDG